MTKAVKKKYNINDLKPTSIRLELKHPKTNKPLDTYVEVVGTESTQYMSVVRELYVKRAKESKLTSEIDAEQAINESTKIMASCIVGWDEEFFLEPYSPAAALKLVSTAETSWVKQQIEAFVSERGNFFTK